MRKHASKLLEHPTIYDCVQNVLGAKRIFAILKQAFQAKIARVRYSNVLDIGCGTGVLADWIHGEYYGIDINLRYIQHVHRDKKGYVQVASATALPFRDGCFDLVTTVGVLHHLPKEQCYHMLSEMLRVCRREGHLVIIDGLVPSNRLNLIGYALAKFDRGPYKIRIEAFKQMISEALPSDTQITHSVYPIFPGEYVLSVITK